MRFRVITTATVAVLAAALLLAGDEQMCTASARDCELAIRQMMGGRRYLGAQLEELKPGLVVKSVTPSSPAAGRMAPGDRLIAVNGKPLTLASAREFKQYLAEARQTGRLFIIVERRGAYKKLDVLLAPYSKEQIDKIVLAHLTQSHTATAGGQ